MHSLLNLHNKAEKLCPWYEPVPKTEGIGIWYFCSSNVEHITTPFFKSIFASAIPGLVISNVFDLESQDFLLLMHKFHLFFQFNGLITSLLSVYKASIPALFGDCTSKAMITPVSSALSANFKCGFSAINSFVTGYPIT